MYVCLYDCVRSMYCLHKLHVLHGSGTRVYCTVLYCTVSVYVYVYVYEYVFAMGMRMSTGL